MVESIAFGLMVGFWVLAALVVVLRFSFPKTPLTGKFIEYLANVTVANESHVATELTDKHNRRHAGASL